MLIELVYTQCISMEYTFSMLSKIENLIFRPWGRDAEYLFWAYTQVSVLFSRCCVLCRSLLYLIALSLSTLNFCCLLLFILIGALNVPLQRPASQSSTFVEYTADLAIDGDAESSCSVTDYWDFHPWWKVQLAYPLWVTHVELTNRKDRGEYIYKYICQSTYLKAKSFFQALAQTTFTTQHATCAILTVSTSGNLVSKYITHEY